MAQKHGVEALRAIPLGEPRRGLRREEAARFVGVSPSKFDEMVRDGRMPKPKKIDACSVWDLKRLDLAWDALPGGDDGANPWDDSTPLVEPLERRQRLPRARR